MRKAQRSRQVVQRKVVFILFAVCVLIGTACMSPEQDAETNEPGNTSGEQFDERETVDSFSHISGLAFDSDGEQALFIATRLGLIEVNDDGEWSWPSSPLHRHELLSFAITNEGTFVSSGHPASRSPLLDPLGFIISNDRGQTWEAISLEGEVSFHLIDVNTNNDAHLIGLNPDGENSGLYRSTDGGKSWVDLEASGLPQNSQDVYTLVSDPDDPQRILAGTHRGVIISEDGGETWHVLTRQYTLSGATVGDNGALIAYHFGADAEGGLHISDDFGQTWEPLHLVTSDEDPVRSIAAHPRDPDVLAASTFADNVLYTNDGGENWTYLARFGEPEAVTESE